MSSSSSPPKPKPGSLRDRIAAFEQKPASSPAPPPAPRPKPGNLSQWKPRPPSPPHDTQPANDRNDTGMSASDAKESITKGGSLKERMAALQGLGAFGGGPAAALPPKPAEKPKWKPPPQVAVAPPVTGDDDEADGAEADNKPAISPLKSPSDDIVAALSKHPQPAPIQEGQPEVEGEAPVAGEEVPDPDEEERQRRAAIAARMARLGGTRVGMGPPIFGRKPEIKPKPAIPAPETTKEEHTIANVPVAEPALRSEDDAEHAHAEPQVTADVPLPTLPPTNETLTETQPEVTSSEYFAQQPATSASPNVPPRVMPVPQVPRRAAPPRKKSSQKQAPPAEAEAIALSPENPIESQSAPVPLPGDVEPEVRATDPDADDVHLADLADKNLELTEHASSVIVPPILSPEEESAPAPPRPASPPLEPQPDSLHNPDVDPSPTQVPDDIAEPIVPSISTTSQVTQEETEVEEVAIPHASNDEALVAAEEEEVEDDTDRERGIAEHVAEMGGEKQLPYISSAAIAVESHPAASATSPESVSYEVFQQGGGATAVDEDDGNDESDPHTLAQAPLQHALGDEYPDDLEGGVDYDDAHTRVPREEVVGAFPQAAEIRQPSAANEGERVVAASSPPSTVHGQHATDDFKAAQAPDERSSLVPAHSADDISDDEMAPPRVTRPLPPDPPAPASVSGDLASALARAPPSPIVPKRTSLPPPARTVPVPLTDSPPRVPSSSPHRAPIAKRASLAPPSRGIPSPAPDSLDIASLRSQPSTRRTSLPPPTRPAPSLSVSREGSLVPPPPPPPGLSYSEDSQESGQINESPRDEVIASPLHAPTPTRKPTIAPPVPDGRKNVESRRSTDSRSSHEERRSSAQYATLIAPAISGPISPPKKRVPSSLPLEKEVLDEDIGDPIDPRFHAPSKSPGIPQFPHSSSPMSGMDPVLSVPPATPPATPPPLPSANESGREGLQRRVTIAERMAKLGGIKFGAPPPVNRVQPSGPTQPAEDAGTEESTAGSGQPVPEEEENEEDEQARRQRIAAKIAGMGGMRVGMLPTQPGVAPVSTPPRQPAAHYHEQEQEYEQPSSSDDGVQVEAEESELEELGHEDLEDEYDNGAVEEETPVVPPPPPPRSTHPPIPTTRPPIPPALLPGRSGSTITIMPPPRPPVRQFASDFVMVEPEEAPLPSPTRHSRIPSHQWSVHPPQESSDLAGSSQWELPSIPSGSLDLGTGDLSVSLWSEDSTAYPPAVPSRSSISTPPPGPLTGGAPQQPVGQRPRTPVLVPSQMTSDDLRALWERVGVYVGEAASQLLERSKRTLVGNGSYEGFIAEALALVPNALPPQSPGEYGILIYAQTAAQVHTRVTDILRGDIVVLDAAKLKGHKGLHTSRYSISAGEGAPCMGIVNEFDVKKLKLKALQANQRVGQATVESVSYRLEDLKSGTIKVYRVREA